MDEPLRSSWLVVSVKVNLGILRIANLMTGLQLAIRITTNLPALGYMEKRVEHLLRS